MKVKKDSETVRAERPIDIGWSAAADEAVNQMEAEFTQDHKTFFNHRNGSGRAQGMIANLKALETRLQKFVRK